MNIEIMKHHRKRKAGLERDLGFGKILPTICLPWIGQQSRAGAMQDRPYAPNLHGSPSLVLHYARNL